MKANLKIQGVIEMTQEDLFEAFRLIAQKKVPDVIQAVSMLVEQKYQVTPKSIQKNEDLTKVTAIIDQVIDQGAQALGRLPKGPIDRESNAGFNRRWTGFYNTAKEIFDEERSRKKHSLSFMDFYNRLLDADDVRSGGKLFIKKNPNTGEMESIEMTRVKQYLSPSQLKKTPQMKGIKWDDKNQEFRF